tara:strand:+ start:442 stop:606 length:165 start_codon:yes stop_codon:yes gene_type:complete
MIIGLLAKVEKITYLSINKIVIDMKILEFFKKFPDQASCKTHFKAERDKTRRGL